VKFGAVVVATLLVSPLSLAAPSPAPERAAASPRIEPGTQGTVRTVLQGTDVVDLPLEFLGLYEDAIGPGYDLYLVRLSGAEADKVGIAAGMSGSPVYVDGEIVGALSYRIGFLPKEPIAGVTPIRDMLDAARAQTAPSGSGSGGVAPIATPIFLGGVARPVAEHLQAELEKLGFVFVMSGGGESDDTGVPAPLGPGSPVGVQLVRGDMTVAATGTVTWVDDTRVLAFGHPMLGVGRTDLPMVAADVLYTLPDLGGSVRLSTVGQALGAFREDRLTAIVGQLGVDARTVPVKLRVEGGDHPTREFSFELARHSSLTPVLAGAVVSNALVLSVGYDEAATVRIDGQIRVAGLPTVPVRIAVASGPGSHPYVTAAARIGQLVATLYGNPFSELDIDAIDLRIDIARERTEYRLESIHFDRGPVRPGQLLEVTCVLASYRAEAQSRALEIQVPPDVGTGSPLSLVIGDPASVARVLGNPLARRLQSADDLESYIRILGEVPASDRLTAVLYRKAAGAVSRGAALAGLPLTAANLLGSQPGGSGDGYLTVAPLASAGLKLDGPVEGSVLAAVEVEGSRPGAKEDEP